jgi:5'-nucleotidase / UDP-sugar diphosphatase
MRHCFASCVVLWFAATMSAQEPVAPSTPSAALPPAANVVFLHWNDFHGQFRPQRAFWKKRPGLPAGEAPLIGGAAALAGFVRREREVAKPLGQRVITTDAGDWYQGTLEGNETKGLLTVQFLSRLAPDAAVLGNHEYDFGPDNVRALVAAAKFPVLGANVVDANATPRRLCDYVQPFAIVEAHGLRIAIVGLITRDTKAVSTGPWGEAAFEAELQALRIVLPAAKAAGHVVVLLTHCGVDVDRELAKAFPELPLILGGHSHTGLLEPLREGDTWIVQTHGKASGVVRLEAFADVAQQRLVPLRGKLHELDPTQHPDDPETAAWITTATKELAAAWDQPIGVLDIPPYEDRGPRSTPVGNLVADAFRSAAGAEVGLTNKGGLRTQLVPGPLTKRQVYELLPFDNTLVSLTLTGAQLRRILQGALAKGRRPLEIGGGSYRYREQDGERVLIAVTVGDAALDDARSYRVATSSFLGRGGDGLTTFAEGTDRKDHGLLLRDVLIAQAVRDGGLTAGDENRIVFAQD